MHCAEECEWSGPVTRPDRIEPFSIDVPEPVLDDLAERLRHARPAADFGNEGWVYGTSGAALSDLLAYWRDRYDWRARETLMNAFPHFRTEIEGLPVHFLHVRGQGPSPMPLIMTHGWPSTFWDFHKVIGPLADPASHGGDPADAFDIVVPSLPGHGFSSPLTRTGVNFVETADLWVKLMERLDYPRFAAQGGDWGAFVSAQLGHKYAERLIGVHLELQVPLNVFSGGISDPADFGPDERHLLERNLAFWAAETGYLQIQATKPQTLANALNDSPIGLLSWIVEKWRSWSDCGGGLESRFTMDELLDTVMIYWITQTAGTAARYYYEAVHRPWQPSHTLHPVVQAPTCAVRYPGEMVHQPRAWLHRYHNVEAEPEMSAGGHFPQMEVPELLVESIRNFYRSKR